MHDSALISCDAGVHPGWPVNDSPTAGWIFRIDFRLILPEVPGSSLTRSFSG
jgi:hypothetical protein